MIVVHHLNNSRSQRVLWLLEELGLEYEIRRYQRDAKTMLAPASLRAVHPLGKSPVITDGALTLAESGAILEYVIERYGGGGSRRRSVRPSGCAIPIGCTWHADGEWRGKGEGSCPAGMSQTSIRPTEK